MEGGGSRSLGEGLRGSACSWPVALPRLLWVYFCCSLQQGFCEMGDAVGVGGFGQISRHE